MRLRFVALISALAVASGYQAGISRVAVPRRAATLQASIADDALESILAKIEAGKQRLAQIEELKVQLEQASRPAVSALASRSADLLDLVKEAQKQRDAAEAERHEVRYDVLTAQHESANTQAEQTIDPGDTFDVEVGSDTFRSRWAKFCLKIAFRTPSPNKFHLFFDFLIILLTPGL